MPEWFYVFPACCSPNFLGLHHLVIILENAPPWFPQFCSSFFNWSSSYVYVRPFGIAPTILDALLFSPFFSLCFSVCGFYWPIFRLTESSLCFVYCWVHPRNSAFVILSFLFLAWFPSLCWSYLSDSSCFLASNRSLNIINHGYLKIHW